MTPRRKILIGLAAAVVLAFAADRLVVTPWMARWERLGQEIARADEALLQARTALMREQAARRGWEELQLLLNRPRLPDVPSHFQAHLSDLAQRVGVTFDIQGGQRLQQQGDFREYVYETRFKLAWEQLVRLLVELHNSEEFLRPLRLNIASRYEREDRLDLDLRVSTIEYAPVRGGAP